MFLGLVEINATARARRGGGAFTSDSSHRLKRDSKLTHMIRVLRGAGGKQPVNAGEGPGRP
jgi:hypothetical protein